ncbi:Uncharacterised protein [Mycobacteroides abscessus]|nr:Uncharacterised protein [Mycobacteroides abscessus]
MISSPDSGSVPTTRGSDSRRSASSIVIVSSDCVLSSDAVRGLGCAAFAFFCAAAERLVSIGGRSSTSVTYGP